MTEETFSLSPQQVHFLETFGFLELPGLFADEIADIEAGFEEVFAEHDGDAIIIDDNPLHGHRRRKVIMTFAKRHPYLSTLIDDYRVKGIVKSIFKDEEVVYTGSDGNLFDCPTYWHIDAFGAPPATLNLKLSFYLSPSDAQTGGIRMIPGSNFFLDRYARAVRDGMERTEEVFGVPPDQLPSYDISTKPGDLVIWNFRTLHASFNGPDRRRLFSLNFKRKED